MLTRASASAQPPSPSSFRLTMPPPPPTTSLDLDGMVMSFSFLLWQTWTLGNFHASIWGQRDVAVNGCRDKDGTGDNKPAPDGQTGQMERCCPCATSLHDFSEIGSIYSIFQVIVHELSFFFSVFLSSPILSHVLICYYTKFVNCDSKCNIISNNDTATTMMTSVCLQKDGVCQWVCIGFRWLADQKNAERSVLSGRPHIIITPKTPSLLSIYYQASLFSLSYAFAHIYLDVNAFTVWS